MKDKIEQQQEKIINLLKIKDEQKIKEEYEKLVKILTQELGLEIKKIDQDLKSKISETEKNELMNKKQKLIEEYKKTIVLTAHQIEELIEK